MYSVVLLAALAAGDVPALGPGCGGPGAAPGWPGAPYGPSPFGYPSGNAYTNCWGGCSGFYPWNPGVFTPSAPVPAPGDRRQMPRSDQAEKPEKPDDKPPKKKEPPGAAAPAPARLLVQVPPGARLLIDGQPSRSAAAVRLITTPDLEPGETYYYVLRVEGVRDGKPFAQERRVFLRPGEEPRVSFVDPGPFAEASAR
jgi:uncharacterized protein (TIGR03000 family)